MTGMQEILVIVLLFVFLIFLPRWTSRGRGSSPKRTLLSIPGQLRLAIVVSAVWIIVWTAYLQPWRSDLLPFTLIGLCPVILGWGVIWIIAGFRKKQDV